MNISEAFKAFAKCGDMDLANIEMDSTKETNHVIKHRFKETILVPYVAVTNNIDLLMSKGEHFATTADGVKCKIKKWEEIHLCDIEPIVQELYGTDTMSFVRKWYSYQKQIDSMYFLKIELEKI